jgi:hypothetical protein
MADDIYWRPAFDLILEEARRSIDRQSERLQHVRERAVGLVGFGSLVAAGLSFHGSGRLGIAGVVAVAAFVVVTGSALFVLYPREFKFELGPSLMDSWFDHPDSQGINHMLHSTATHHGSHHHYNHQKLKWMQASLAVGVAALAVETVALVVRLML